MKNIKLLDCTFRDGAHINDGLFGVERSRKILNRLTAAGVDYIELGFIEPNVAKDGSTYFSSANHAEDFFSLNNLADINLKKGLMIRTDRCDLKNIHPNKYINFIRIAFYPEHLEDVVFYTKVIHDMGYNVYLNLIAVTSYEVSTIQRLLDSLCKNNNFSGLSIVDTYGALNEKYLLVLLKVFEKYLDENQELGLHLHENLNRASLLYRFFVENTVSKNLIIDCSLGGMGRVPGNLPTEVCAHIVNEDFKKNYDVNILAKTATQEIQIFKKINEWGYLSIYAISAILNIDRSYPEYFEKSGLSNEKNIEAQTIIAERLFGGRFNRELANQTIKIVG